MINIEFRFLDGHTQVVCDVHPRSQEEGGLPVPAGATGYKTCVDAATPGQVTVPREPLEALIRAWSAKADEPDRDPYAAAAYRIAKGNLVDVLRKHS